MAQDLLNALDIAREHFELARRAEDARLFADAATAYQSAVEAAGPAWERADVAAETRTIAARLSADAAYAAGMCQARLHPPETDALRAATLLGVRLFEREDLPGDVRLHGIYRAQCAAFEMGHQCMEYHPAQAKDLFQDAIGCVGALAQLTDVEEPKVARLYANAAAAASALAGLVKDQEKEFKQHLQLVLEHGQEGVDTGKLPLGMETETLILMGDAAYELGLLEKEQPKAVERLKDALGWTRQAAESPGADANLQADALLRGARYACVYGLYLRHSDFDGGIDALDGSVNLALSVASSPNLPPPIRATAFDTAVRTQQNIALLFKEHHPDLALDAFAKAADLGISAAASGGDLPPAARATLIYLAANARLEQAILLQVAARSEADAQALGLFAEVKQLARNVFRIDGAPHETVARAGLLACGASGRLLRAIDPSDAAAIDRELEAIERFGQQASSQAQASEAIRARGAFFAADAAAKLASRAASPAKQAEAQHRADTLMALYRSLDPEANATMH